MSTKTQQHHGALAAAHKSVLNGKLLEGTYVHYDGEVFLVGLEGDDDMDNYLTVCHVCLIDRAPAVGRGMDVARVHEAARYVDGEWVEVEA